MSPILSTSHCEFNGSQSCTHTQKIIPIHLFTKQMVHTFIVSRIVDSKLVQISFTCFLYAPYKVLPSINNIFTCTSFFLCFHFLSFSLHIFSWACGSLHEPWKFFKLSFCTFTSLSNTSLIS